MKRDGDIDAELRDHIERQAADLRREGLDAAEARRRAAAMFGSVAATREACRDAHGARWLEDLAADTRYAFRLLRRSPGFSAVAVLSLALGLGANIAVASLLDAVVLRTLPVPSPQELLLLAERAPDRETYSWSRTQFEELGASETLSGLCAFRPRVDIAVDGAAGADLARGQLVSANCFEVLGLRPALGRLLTRDDDRPGDPRAVAVVGYGFWKRYLGGDPSAIGRTLRVKGQPFTIVGVTPPDFLSLEPGQTIDVTVPLSQVSLSGGLARAGSTARWLRLIGRIAPGVTRDRAAADLERRWRHLSGRPVAADARLEVQSGAQGLNELRRQFSAPLRILFAGVGLLLLVTCANLASLLIARAHARDLELRMRTALGAARGRLVRQLVTESCVLSVLGGLAGTALAIWGGRAIIVLLSRGRMPIALPLTLNGRLLAFALALTVLTALIFGVWPALWATRRTSHAPEGLRSTKRSRGATATLTAGQTCLSAILLAGALLFSRSLANLRSIDLGADARHVVIAAIQPGVAGMDRTRMRPLYRDLWSRLSASPGVRSASMVMDLPLGGVSYTAGVSAPSVGRKDDQINFNFVGPRFFETMGIPILAGRDLRLEDDDRSPAVAVVSAALAAQFFPNRQAVGEHLDTGDLIVEIVGVAADVHYTGLRAPKERMLYRPYFQQTGGGIGVVFAIRTDLPAPVTADIFRAAVRDLAPAVPVAVTDTLEARVDASMSSERLLAAISTFFGAMALLLVGIGVYGTLAYAIAQRTRELGVRQALGAAPRDIARLVLSGALTPVGAGLVVGLPLAIAAAKTASAQLFGITAAAPAIYATTVIVLLGAALAAAAMPMRKALRLDPLSALREP